MYLRKDDLANLLNSFSKGEKKYLFQYLKALNHKETPLYLNLLKQPKSALNNLPYTQSAQTYTKAKKRLYTHLIQCLLHYHEGKSTETIIHNLLCKIEILYDRGLPDQCVILLEKAHALALENERYGLVLQVLDWERKLNIILDHPRRTSKEIAQEEKKILENLNQIIELEKIYSEAREIRKQHGYMEGSYRQRLEHITIKNPYLTTQGEPSSQRARHYYHFIYYLYYHWILDFKQCYRHSRKLMSPDMQRASPNEYLNGLLEHITSCMCLGYFEEMSGWLNFTDVFVQQKQFEHSTSFLLTVFYFQAIHKLVMYIYTGAIDDLQHAIKETEEKLMLYNKQLSIERKFVLYGNLRNACIAAGDLDKADLILEKILQRETRFIRSDVYNDLFLSRVFSFLASQTYTLVPAMALSAYRHYSSQMKGDKNQLEIGLKITAVLMKDYNYDDQKVKRSVLLKVKEILTKYIASLKGLNNFHEIYSFYAIWTDSMLDGRPFHIVAADWHRRHLNKKISQ